MSKRLSRPISDHAVFKREQAIEHERRAIIRGSKDLARAILRTKKLYSPMSVEDQVAAVEYAYDIKAVIRR